MAKGTALSVYAGAWTFWVLDFAGWATLLGGVSAMQDVEFIFASKKNQLSADPKFNSRFLLNAQKMQSCGGSAANYLLGGGSAGYHGAVECKFLFGCGASPPLSHPLVFFSFYFHDNQ